MRQSQKETNMLLFGDPIERKAFQSFVNDYHRMESLFVLMQVNSIDVDVAFDRYERLQRSERVVKFLQQNERLKKLYDMTYTNPYDQGVGPWGEHKEDYMFIISIMFNLGIRNIEINYNPNNFVNLPEGVDTSLYEIYLNYYKDEYRRRVFDCNHATPELDG